MALRIHTLKALKNNFIYLLEESESGHWAVVDPGEFAVVDRFFQGRGITRLQQIICTHHHADHVDGAVALKKKYGGRIITSAKDLARIDGADEGLEHHQSHAVGHARFQALHVPGHTLGQMCLYFDGETPRLFSGDTLFSLGCGRVFEGTYQEMYASLELIKSLPPETEIYFGHEYTARNIEFALQLMSEEAKTLWPISIHQEIEEYRDDVDRSLKQDRPTTPTTLERELRLNPFLNTSDFGLWSARRDRRNEF